ncbi:MAG: alanine--tRNA ligase [Candidatus Azambacteria bacterium]|nr:alanine--tRNA ligase [Candidatus Azambacteria bacterium]
MTSAEIRKKFLEFFSAKGGSASGGEHTGHKIVPSSSLVPEDDSSVLLTTAGMQQFKSYYTGEKDPIKDFGVRRATSIQKCFRTSDIDSVGDESHLTFFEMLGNFSFGDYFKEDAIKWAWEFITQEMKISPERCFVSIFEGDSETPEDTESFKIWKTIGLADDKIKKCGREDNFWGPTGNEGPCGPTTEIYIDGIEVWNLVFNEYYCDANKILKPLKQKGVDTGMGLERLTMAVQKAPTIFETDLFKSLIATNRIALDHGRAMAFLISDGIRPSNKERGYILRRITRKVMAMKEMEIADIENLLKRVVKEYKIFYGNLEETTILEVFKEENEKFQKAKRHGIKELKKIDNLDAVRAFSIFESYGLTFDVIKDIAGAKAANLNQEDFDAEFKKHQKISRAGSEKKFKGGLADASEQTIKYHTAAHLMLAALRQTLGNGVVQKGANITAERLRFDFSYSEKMTPEQIKKVENLVNEKITEDLPVICEEMELAEAKAKGAMGVFDSKYEEKVKVYTIGDHPFSREICGGPHVERTGQIGRFKIVKEESSSAGVRRIRAVVE